MIKSGPLPARALSCLVLSLAALAQVAAAAQHNSSSTSTLIQTSSGLLAGLESKPQHAGYQSVIKFLGVPYAKPPIGPLRFKRAQPLGRANENATLDATRYGPTCPQHEHLVRFISPLLNIDQQHQISEDCLQLNVFVPTISGEANRRRQLPVIVWIPGEGFDFADARQFDASQLALRTQSIVVTVQYRVGVFGLLDAPELGLEGNQAIHDQLEALRWVSRNIGAFGGDRERVTVMGRFTGAMSISAMLTAPNQELVLRPTDAANRTDKSALFSRAILTSGIAVDDWIIVDNQRAKLDQLLEGLRSEGLCAATSGRPALDCLQSVPMRKLLQLSGYKWRLVRDNQLISQRGGPIELLRQAQATNFKLPRGIEAVMLGETGAEGTLCLFRHLLMAHENERARLIDEGLLTGEHLNELIRDDLATYFSYNTTATSNQALEMALDALIESSTSPSSSSSSSSSSSRSSSSQSSSSQSSSSSSQEPSNGHLRQRYLDACSSFMVRSHNQRFKRHLQQAANGQLQVDHYQLQYKPAFSLAPDYVKTAAHGDDIPLIFGLVYNQPDVNQISASDLVMTERMLKLVGDFAHGRRHKRALKLQHDDEHAGNLQLLDMPSQMERANANERQEVGPTATRATGAILAAKLVIVEPVFQSGSEVTPSQAAPARVQAGPALAVAAATGDDAQADQQQATRSQRLLEMHKQQVLDQLQAGLSPTSTSTMTRPSGGSAPNPQIGAAGNSDQFSMAATEGSMATALLLAASIVILALMSVCVLLSVLVVRYNGVVLMSAGHGQHETGREIQIGARHRRSQQFSSSSTCNICDDSQAGAGSIEAVLNQQAAAATKKGSGATFGNVFAKLQGQAAHQHGHQLSRPVAAPATTTTTTTTLMADGQQEQ